MRLLSRLCIALALIAGPALAETAKVAVAANFRAPLEALAGAFRAETGHALRISSGSTGLLHAQITRGAPFDVFLAADQARPAALVEAELAVPESLFTYARGRLAFIATDPALIRPDGPDLARIGTLSIANPSTAPYGAAAMEVLAAIGPPYPERIAHAQSVAGVSAAVASGAAEAGFAALASVHRDPASPRWVVPERLHQPIRQDVVLLRRAAGNSAARALVAWLAGPEAGVIIQSFGYDRD